MKLLFFRFCSFVVSFKPLLCYCCVFILFLFVFPRRESIGNDKLDLL